MEDIHKPKFSLAEHNTYLQLVFLLKFNAD